MTFRSCLMATCVMLATACGSAPEPEQTKGENASPAVATAGDTTRPRLNPGLWQTTSDRAKVAGLQESRCISKEEADRTVNGSDDQIRKALEEQTAKDSCTLDEVRINGSTIAFGMTCSGMKMSVSTDYRGDSSTTTMTSGAMGTMTTEGVRKGDC